MYSINAKHETKIIINYKFYLRQTRKKIERTRFFYSKLLNKTQNLPIMFVRAPKHFKSGKQHVFFFNSIRRKHCLIRSRSCSLFYLYGSSIELFNLFSRYFISYGHNDIKISRLTCKNIVTLSYTKWLVFFLCN